MKFHDLLDNAKCYEQVRLLRWPDGVTCPRCNSQDITRQGKDDSQPEKQRYWCKQCQRRFDDLKLSIFSGHHQPLKIWVHCLYLMSLNQSNHQIHQELDLNNSSYAPSWKYGIIGGMKNDLIELYSDYLLSSFGKTTATGVAELLDNAYSHDQFTRLLSTNEFTSRSLWLRVKSFVRQIEDKDGVLIFDDTIQEKPFSKENALNTWHFDHTKNRTVKGINLLNAHYHADDASLPVAYQLVEKTIQYTDLKTKKVRRYAEHTKNEMMREMLKTCCHNQLLFRYVLADSWFCSNDNMMFIRHDCNKHFLMAMKSNRKISLSLEDKLQGLSRRIDTVDFSEDSPVKGWIAGIDFPVLLFRQVFKNKDDSTGILYLVCSDLNCDAKTLRTLYKKRWKVEVFHKTLKSNTAMAKSPAHTIRTQSNHIFLSIYSAAIPERYTLSVVFI